VIVRINPDWRIESDPLQWIIQKRRTVKGAERWSNVSYHRTLDSAVVQLAQRRVRMIGGEYPPEALPTLCHALDSLRDEISQALHMMATSQRRRDLPPLTKRA